MAYATKGAARRGRALTARGAARRAAEAIVGGGAFLLLFQYALGFNLVDTEFWSAFRVFFLPGLLGTLFFVAITIPLSVAVGFVAAWARTSKYRVLSWPSTLYVEFFRGVPALVVVIFASLFGTDLFPPRYFSRTAGFVIAAMALALHSGAYQAEIFRAGFQSVPRGQLEAAQALGMNPLQSLRHVILPQALRVSLPPLGNEFAVEIKDTSLLYAIGAVELFGAAYDFGTVVIFQFRDKLHWLFAIWTGIALLYFVMTFFVTRLLIYVEKRVRVPGLEGIPV